MRQHFPNVLDIETIVPPYNKNVDKYDQTRDLVT